MIRPAIRPLRHHSGRATSAACSPSCVTSSSPPVGIILCAQKDKSVARYSVLHGNEQLFAIKYKLILPSEEELRAELIREQRVLAEQSPEPPWPCEARSTSPVRMALKR